MLFSKYFLSSAFLIIEQNKFFLHLVEKYWIKRDNINISKTLHIIALFLSRVCSILNCVVKLKDFKKRSDLNYVILRVQRKAHLYREHL